MRIDGRAANELRPFSIQPNFVGAAPGSALVTAGRTRVICTASTSRTPPWLEDGGWITAEYAMLPGATSPRGRRDPGGRGKEIQRLIGRSLRACVDLGKLTGPDGPISITCDCDVIEADGGTRTAAITGAYVALVLCLEKLRSAGKLHDTPILGPVAAVSVGLVQARTGADGEPAGDPIPMLDLAYDEDSRAGVDMNVVALRTPDGAGLVEVQGTGEQGTFSRDELTAMLDLADAGIEQLLTAQREALGQEW